MKRAKPLPEAPPEAPKDPAQRPDCGVCKGAGVVGKRRRGAQARPRCLACNGSGKQQWEARP